MRQEMITARADALEGAADLIENHDWCQRALARDKDGEPTHVLDEGACEFCLQGALMKTCWVDEETHAESIEHGACYGQYMGDDEPTDGLTVYHMVVFDTESSIPMRGVTLDQFNDFDSTTKEKVLGVLRKAAERVRKEQPDEEDE